MNDKNFNKLLNSIPVIKTNLDWIDCECDERINDKVIQIEFNGINYAVIFSAFISGSCEYEEETNACFDADININVTDWCLLNDDEDEEVVLTAEQQTKLGETIEERINDGF